MGGSRPKISPNELREVWEQGLGPDWGAYGWCREFATNHQAWTAEFPSTDLEEISMKMASKP